MMDSIPAIFATSFLVALPGALVPCPMFTLTVAEPARGGWSAGPMVAAGLVASGGDVVHGRYYTLVMSASGGFLVMFGVYFVYRSITAQG
jgi:threonine/homoserine/homoserine lactone efflux protein